jgi:ribonucleoside-triphosphate reductase
MIRYEPSVRAEILTRRTYNRPKNDEGTEFESWEETVSRVISHQAWLWERAKGARLRPKQIQELQAFEQLMLDRKVSVSGRTLWLGGTDVAKKREASQFNCAHTNVGFTPVRGTLNGFFKPIKTIEVVRSERTEKGGETDNRESWDPKEKVWTIAVGDCAESWAKSIGKLLAGKYPANKLILDFSSIRPAGERLKGYGWISCLYSYCPYSE